MNLFWAVILLPVGLLFLIKGADLLVDGAIAIARRFGINPLIIGLTIVAMGTSAPEVAASIKAVIDRSVDIAIGNVYGSNIANLALVGGICALIRPIAVRLSALRREMPIMLFVALLLFPCLLDKKLGMIDGVILLVVFVCIMIFSVYYGLREAKKKPGDSITMDHQIHDASPEDHKPIHICSVLILLGLVGLAVGAHLTVESAKFIGKLVGLSDAVIGITIIAIGTSLPELMTSVVAAFKGHDDISIGNLVGSNIFNTLLVIGTAGIVGNIRSSEPLIIDSRFIGIDYWLMIAISSVFLVVAIIEKKIGRKSGLFLTCVYVAYMIYLFALTK